MGSENRNLRPVLLSGDYKTTAKDIPRSRSRILRSRKDDEQIPGPAKARRHLQKRNPEYLQIICGSDGGPAEKSIDRSHKAGADPYAL